MNLDIIIEQEAQDSCTVTITGRIDSENYTEFEKKVEPLLEKDIKHMVLDLAGLDYISSAGMGVIFGMMKKLRPKNCDLLFCSLKPQVRKVFEIVKAISSEDFFASRSETDAHLELMKEKLLESNRNNN